MVQAKATKAATFELPESLKGVLEKLPTPEAIRVIEDVGKAAWIIDNNNNNNKKSVYDDKILEKLPSMSSEQIKQISKVLGPEI